MGAAIPSQSARPGAGKGRRGAPESEDVGADPAYGLSHRAATPGMVPRQTWSLLPEQGRLRGVLFQPLV